jgi:hypothetical protein
MRYAMLSLAAELAVRWHMRRAPHTLDVQM